MSKIGNKLPNLGPPDTLKFTFLGYDYFFFLNKHFFDLNLNIILTILLP